MTRLTSGWLPARREGPSSFLAHTQVRRRGIMTGTSTEPRTRPYLLLHTIHGGDGAPSTIRCLLARHPVSIRR